MTPVFEQDTSTHTEPVPGRKHTLLRACAYSIRYRQVLELRSIFFLRRYIGLYIPDYSTIIKADSDVEFASLLGSQRKKSYIYCKTRRILLRSADIFFALEIIKNIGSSLSFSILLEVSRSTFGLFPFPI